MFRSLLLLASLCAAFDARAEWFRAETPHFVLQADATEPEVRQMAAELESLDAVMRGLFGVTTPPGRSRADILVIDDVATVRRLTGMNWFVGGVTIAARTGEVILVSRRFAEWGLGFDVRESLYHEYAHSFMRRHLSTSYPGWYVEGFASFFETARLVEGGQIRMGTMPGGYDAVLRGKNIGFADVMSVEAFRSDGPAPAEVYALGWLITHHLFAGGPRAAEIRAYLRAVASGEPVSEPDKFFAGGIKAFDADMTAYFQGERPIFRNEARAPDPASIAVRPMRSGESAYVLFRLEDMPAARSEAIAGTRPSRFKVTCDRHAKAKQLLDRFPDERGPRLHAGRTALACGETVAAAALADALLAAEPADPTLLAFKADVLVLTARDNPRRMTALFTQARELLRRASQIDANDPAVAVASYNLSSADLGVSLQTRRLLDRAIELNPDDLVLRFTAVDLALREEDTRYAIALLTPIANSPHESGLRDAAIQMIAAIRKLRR